MLILLFKGKQGKYALKNVNTEINRHLPENKKAKLIYTGIKLGSKFYVKDVTKKEHQYDLIYRGKCPLEICDKSYNGEIGRSLAERVETKTPLCVNIPSTKTVKLWNFRTVKFLAQDLDKIKKKISETLFIKGNKPSLNRHIER